jgi:hypothetical protein
MKRHAPAADRNKAPILEIPVRILDDAGGTLLEIASGTGQHAVHFAEALPRWTWQPSDGDPDTLPSIEAHRRDAALDNLLAPVHLDVTRDDWGEAAANLRAVFCANMIHISPWSCSQGLFAGAGRHLPPGAPMLLYGPFRFDGTLPAASNQTFDASLRARDPSWGIRDVRDLNEMAQHHGLVHEDTIAMPANNHILVWRRVAPALQ